jgi:FRG domain
MLGGVVIHSVSSLAEAVRVAEKLRASRMCDWFRGQARNWPLQSSFVRRDDAGREVARKRLARFHNWLRRVPQLTAIASDIDAVHAVAQHYGIPTNLVDFTTEPSVAAFFAVHDPPQSRNQGDASCIICLNTHELADVWEATRLTRPDWPEFVRVQPDIPELWRIQSQRGVFLSFPFDEGFERYIFDFDRICFPPDIGTDEVLRLIPTEDIYPSQKSELETLLDQYFMLEGMEEGQRALDSDSVLRVQIQPLPEGIEPECFGPRGLPEHDSWRPDRLTQWRAPTLERWVPISKAPLLQVAWPSGESGDAPARHEQLAEHLLGEIARAPDCRAGPVRWEHVGPSPVEAVESISRAMSLLWDGLRRWPFSNLDLAYGLATTAEFAHMVAAEPAAQYDSDLADALAACCLGTSRTIEVEIGMSDASYTTPPAR